MGIRILEYLDNCGSSPFSKWFDALDAVAAARVTATLNRLELGNFSSTKPVGGGVIEYRIHSGPGYRIYFGRDGDELVILLAGGSKRRQQHDINKARTYWKDYKQRKRQQTNAFDP